MTIDLATISLVERQSFLQHAVVPRPIALASTIDKNGNVNLSAFSFFNLFSTQPPIVIFSPVRRVRNNTTKHTLENIKEVPEVVIHVVTYNMVQQVSLTSCEYEKEIDEFIKAGFTKEKATQVQPPMVQESPIKLECKVAEIKAWANNKGAGNLVICEVLCMHINDNILSDNKSMIDQTKFNPVARLGGDWYGKMEATNLFEVAKPNTQLGIGFDNLPTSVLHSKILTGNHLAQLANVEAIPNEDEQFTNMAMTFILKQYQKNEAKRNGELHKLAAEILNNGSVTDAWQVLLRADKIIQPTSSIIALK